MSYSSCAIDGGLQQFVSVTWFRKTPLKLPCAGWTECQELSEKTALNA